MRNQVRHRTNCDAHSAVGVPRSYCSHRRAPAVSPLQFQFAFIEGKLKASNFFACALHTVCDTVAPLLNPGALNCCQYDFIRYQFLPR